MHNRAFEKLPWRLFLDSSTLQRLHTYGEFIYDCGSIASEDPVWSRVNGPENIKALKGIIFVGKRASYEFFLSASSLRNVSRF